MRIQEIFKDVRDLIYPPRCVCCGSGEGCGDGAWCGTCGLALAAMAATPMCNQCARPIGPGAACPFCHGGGIHPFEKIAALGPYRDPIRRMIHKMKYRHRWPIAEILADRMLEEDRIRGILLETDVLLAVPLHWFRQIGRGYNQSQTLAHRLAKRCGVRQCGGIVRLKNTAAQTTIRSGADRAANLRNAFALTDVKSIRGKRVTIVDDVLTTASTLKAVGRVLHDAKPANICAVIVAISDPRRRDFQTVLAGRT